MHFVTLVLAAYARLKQQLRLKRQQLLARTGATFRYGEVASWTSLIDAKREVSVHAASL